MEYRQVRADFDPAPQLTIGQREIERGEIGTDFAEYGVSFG